MGRVKAQSPTEETEQKTLKDHFPVTSEAVESIKEQLKQLIAEAKKQGVTIGVTEANDFQLPPLVDDVKLEWTLEDFGPKEEWVQYIPSELPELQNAIREDVDGRRFIELQINGHRFTLQVGAINRVPQAVKDTYENLREQSLANRKLQRAGPDHAPWTHGGPSGVNTWYFNPESPTAWLDIDGMYLSPNRTYIMYKGVPVPVDDFTLLKGNHFEISKVDQNANNKQVDRLAGMTYPENEPEPDWRKTNPWKKPTKTTTRKRNANSKKQASGS